MEDGTITDDQISASSTYFRTAGHSPNNARLDFTAGNGRFGAWCALTINANQWIQGNLLTLKTVSGIVIQGRPGRLQWVVQYKVQYGNDGMHWQTVKEANGEDAVGNV